MLPVTPPDSQHEVPNDPTVVTITSREAAKRYLDLQLATVRTGDKRMNEDLIYSELQLYTRKHHKASDRHGSGEHQLCDLVSSLVIRPSLLNLPAELRNAIYRMVFGGDQDIVTVRESTVPLERLNTIFVCLNSGEVSHFSRRPASVSLQAVTQGGRAHSLSRIQVSSPCFEMAY